MTPSREGSTLTDRMGKFRASRSSPLKAATGNLRSSVKTSGEGVKLD